MNIAIYYYIDTYNIIYNLYYNLYINMLDNDWRVAAREVEIKHTVTSKRAANECLANRLM